MDVGLKVKLTKTGGCVSCPNAGTAATMASKSKNTVLADFRTKLQFPHAAMPEPPVKTPRLAEISILLLIFISV